MCENWTKILKEMIGNGHDLLVIPDIFGDEDMEEWEWNTIIDRSDQKK